MILDIISTPTATIYIPHRISQNSLMSSSHSSVWLCSPPKRPPTKSPRILQDLSRTSYQTPSRFFRADDSDVLAHPNLHQTPLIVQQALSDICLSRSHGPPPRIYPHQNLPCGQLLSHGRYRRLLHRRHAREYVRLQPDLQELAAQDSGQMHRYDHHVQLCH